MVRPRGCFPSAADPRLLEVALDAAHDLGGYLDDGQPWHETDAETSEDQKVG